MRYPIALLCLLLSACSTIVEQDFTDRSRQGTRHIALFLDGTANDAEVRTNVMRLFELTANQDRDDLALFYNEGVGSDMRVLGAITGWGIGKDVKEAYAFLMRAYTPEDNPGGDHKLYVFGFSRGGYAARILTGLVHLAGIPALSPALRALSPDDQRRLTEEFADALYDAHKIKGADKARRLAAMEPVWRHWVDERGLFVRRAAAPAIDFLVLWDTVESLGVRGLGFKTPNSHYFDKLCNVRTALHAVALDDNRARSYKPQSILGEYPLIGCEAHERDVQRHEVWFAGAHADVGGGYGDTLLSSLSLNWVLAHLLSGPPQQPALVPREARVRTDLRARVHDAERDNLLYRVVFKRENRSVAAYLCEIDGSHHDPSDGQCVNDAGRHPASQSLKVHESVVARLRQIGTLDNQIRCPHQREADGPCNYNSRWYEAPPLGDSCFVSEPSGQGLRLKPSCRAIDVVRDPPRQEARRVSDRVEPSGLRARGNL